MAHESAQTLQVRQASCPACGHHVAVPLLRACRQPLATLGWPRSATEAQEMDQLELDFVRCIQCGHIFNTAFQYADVPYDDRPNLMFNKGHHWSAVIETLIREIARHLSSSPVVVEIGHGDGSFLYSLSRQFEAGRFIGFDPHGATDSDGTLEFRRELFMPSQHVAELKPDLVISRHVLEHLTNPLGFLQELSFAATLANQQLLAYFEVPCVDQMIASGRTVDLYYEHNSQFTTQSFRAMLGRCNAEVERIDHLYHREVIYGFVRLGGLSDAQLIAEQSQQYHDRAEQALETVKRQLDALAQGDRPVAIWGGTGKSAAFMNRYALDAERFPLVVDSDPDKVGTFVPGTGQEIQFRDALKSRGKSVIIIPPQWRAHDILVEIACESIPFANVFIEHEGQLIDYLGEQHPYPVP